jgi:quercetin dioxygenase-like cupin family protein
MTDKTVTVVGSAAVSRNEFPGGTWSKLLISRERVEGNQSSLGHSYFPVGAVTDPIVHEVEEVVYVTGGAGELRTDVGNFAFHTGDALHIPPGVWHSIAVSGDQPVTMVFGVPYPEYPATRRK